MSSQKPTTKYPKVTTAQIKAIAEIVALLQELNERSSGHAVAEILGIKPQTFQQHINNIKAKRGGTK